jgi:hypothetical protein
MKFYLLGIACSAALLSCGPSFHPLAEELGKKHCSCEQGMVDLAKKDLGQIQQGWDSLVQQNLRCMGNLAETNGKMVVLKPQERFQVMEDLPRYQQKNCPEIWAAKEKINALLSR